MDRRRFGRLAPREFTSLREAWEDREDRLDSRAYVVAAAFYDVNRDTTKRKVPITALDLWTPRRKRKKAPEMSDEEKAKQRARNMRLFVENVLHPAFGGEAKKPIYPENSTCPS